MATCARLEVAAGLAVLLTSLTATLTAAPAVGTVEASDAAFPTRVADYSYLTGSVSAAPPGRAVAIFQHGFGVEFMDYPQAVLVGADGTTYRRVDLAERLGGPEGQGDPAPLTLSPDGLSVAVGDYAADAADLAVLDVRTGDVERHAVGAARGVIPRAWSPERRQLAFVSGGEPYNPYQALHASSLEGDLGLLDVDSGEVRMLPNAEGVGLVAYSPNGTRLAVERGRRIEIRTLDGAITRTLAPPPQHHLDGPAAWSPDGALLAVGNGHPRCQQSGPDFDELAWDACLADTESKTFLDATGGQGPVPDPLLAGSSGFGPVLGWSGPREVLVLDDVVPSDPSIRGTYWITAAPLDGSAPRQLSTVPGTGNFGVGSFQLASGLVADLTFEEMGGRADRGPLPFYLAVALSLALGVLTARLTRLARSRRASRPAGR